MRPPQAGAQRESPSSDLAASVEAHGRRTERIAAPSAGDTCLICYEPIQKPSYFEFKDGRPCRGDGKPEHVYCGSCITQTIYERRAYCLACANPDQPFEQYRVEGISRPVPEAQRENRTLEQRAIDAAACVKCLLVDGDLVTKCRRFWLNGTGCRKLVHNFHNMPGTDESWVCDTCTVAGWLACDSCDGCVLESEALFCDLCEKRQIPKKMRSVCCPEHGEDGKFLCDYCKALHEQSDTESEREQDTESEREQDTESESDDRTARKHQITRQVPAVNELREF